MKNKLVQTLNKVGINGFLIGLFVAILLGYLFPTAGSTESPFPWKPIIDIGISLVFFFYGVKLDPVQIKSGLKNWKLHLLIQTSTFLLFPLLVLLILWGFPWIEEEFVLGISYLSALPSTVSASVVMVSIAGGNLPAAIFNASISSLLGVVLTPVWMGFLAGTTGAQIDFVPTLAELSVKVVMPVFLGVMLHGVLFPKLKNHFTKLKYVDQAVIMMIVFTSFAQSFSQKIFSPYEFITLLKIAAFMLGILIIASSIIWLTAIFFRFEDRDRITSLFSGSTKSLVHGVVIGKVIFPDPTVLGLVLLPVMLYHIQQLIIGSMLAGWFGRKQFKIS